MNQLSKFIAALLVKIIILLMVFGANGLSAQRRSTSVNINNNGKTTISIKNGLGNNFSIEYKGEITLSDDDTDVVAISRGGYMEIKKSAFGNRRRISIEPNDSGGLIKKYYVGSSQKSFDAEGKKWLSEILLEVVRTTTLGAEKRVNRLYKAGGSYKVLKEVGKITSNHVKSRYIKLLLKKELKEADLIAVLNEVAEIDSNHHQADILKNNTNVFLAHKGTTAAYIKAAGTIDSDHHKAEVLKKSINDGSISDTQMKALFAITQDIDSDHHKASVLQTVLERRSLNQTNLKLLVNTTRDIDSDHHKASVLKKALNSEELGSDVYNTLLTSVSSIDSDHHLASVFTQLLRNEIDGASLLRLLRVMQDNMSSDNHQATVLKKVLQEQRLSGNSLSEYLSVLRNMDSDHHKASVFKTLSRNDFSDAELVQILKATTSIGSDHHKAESLLGFASKVRSADREVQDAYTSACKDIDSESHFGRALKAIQ
ncbi:hypothetical protein MTsPCn5_05880 [Croceitalea sp. MTPC5]|uniref:hypothetical protein n=1 Tax=Croceitalea sp. MTPC5 TaxID=3056565 RepID=UPI002B3F92B0|nr:hypothetical protein MTsPCn5_05880 [Croceitalea sp. MTPC5]